MRTVIFATSHNSCTMRFTDVFGNRCERNYFASSNGGYVRYRSGNDLRQVCEKLGSIGPTLQWSGDAPLVDLIRKHHRLARAAERRDKAA